MEIEEEARTLGWIPQEEFKGDPSRWTDAETFVSRGKEIMPILRKNNERLLGELETVKSQNAALAASVRDASEALAEFKKYNEETSKRAYEAAIRDLREQKVAALREGDAERVVEIDEAVADLKGQENSRTPVAAPAPTAPTPPSVHPDFAKWEQDNAAWLADKDKSTYAHSIAPYIRSKHPQAQGRDFLDKITEAVERNFGGPTPGQKVEGNAAPNRRSGRGYADLPAEARAACDRFAEKLVGPNKAYKTAKEWQASYVSNYQWD